MCTLLYAGLHTPETQIFTAKEITVLTAQAVRFLHILQLAAYGWPTRHGAVKEGQCHTIKHMFWVIVTVTVTVTHTCRQ